MSTASKSIAKPARLVTSTPKIGATNGAGWKVQVPVWISSVVAHGALLTAFVAIIWVMGLLDKVPPAVRSTRPRWPSSLSKRRSKRKSPPI